MLIYSLRSYIASVRILCKQSFHKSSLGAIIKHTMSKRQTLMILGIWICIFLFLGLPYAWKEALAVLTGIAVIVTAYKIAPSVKPKPDKDMSFVEHKPTNPIISIDSGTNK